MKTAVSLGDELLEQTDRLARQMKVSRSRLISRALQAYLDQRRQQQIIHQLNRVYAGKPEAADAGVTKKMKAKFRSTVRERW